MYPVSGCQGWHLCENPTLQYTRKSGKHLDPVVEGNTKFCLVKLANKFGKSRSRVLVRFNECKLSRKTSDYLRLNFQENQIVGVQMKSVNKVLECMKSLAVFFMSTATFEKTAFLGGDVVHPRRVSPELSVKHFGVKPVNYRFLSQNQRLTLLCISIIIGGRLERVVSLGKIILRSCSYCFYIERRVLNW